MLEPKAKPRTIRMQMENSKGFMTNRVHVIELLSADGKVLLRTGVFRHHGNLSKFCVELQEGEKIVGVSFGQRGSKYARVFDIQFQFAKEGSSQVKEAECSNVIEL